MSRTELVAMRLQASFGQNAVVHGLIDRTPELSLAAIIVDERDRYQLYRVTRPNLPRLQLGVTIQALERMTDDELDVGYHHLLQAATDAGAQGDRWILMRDGRVAKEAAP